MKPPSELEALLSERDWIRRLARRLVRDPDLAEDVTQDALVAALERPSCAGRDPDDAGARRGWLAAVVRNLVRSRRRGEGRRAARERAVARPREAPAVDEVVEELALRREVADAVLALDEPWRGALFLRYFRDRSLKEIAREQGISVSAAHGRVERGLRLVRERLDAAHGGDRRTWVLALLPLGEPSGGLLGASVGGVVVGSALKVAVPVVLAGGGALGWWAMREPEVEREAAGAAVAAAAEPERAPAALSGPVEPVAGEGAGRSAVVPEAEGRAPGDAPAAAAAEPAAPALVTGRVVDLEWRPVAGVEVRTFETHAVGAAAATSDAAGVFEIENTWDEYRWGLLVVADDGWTTVAAGMTGDASPVVVAAPARPISGRVVDRDGAPIAGAQLSVEMRQELFRDLGIKRPFDSPSASRGVRSAADGSFELADAVAGDGVYLWARKQGYDDAQIDLRAGDDSVLLVRLVPEEETPSLRGTVIDERGAPVAGASVSMGAGVVRTDATGRFDLPWEAPYGEELGEVAEVRALHPGHLPAFQGVRGDEVDQPIVLQLGGAPLAISGVVVDGDGEAVPRALVWVVTPTLFGRPLRHHGEYSVSTEQHVEELLAEPPGERGVRADDAGRFRLTGLLDQAYLVGLMDSRSYAMSSTRLQAGLEDVELVLDFEPGLVRRVAGRVVSSSGEPLAGCRIFRDVQFDGDLRPANQPPQVHLMGTGVRTDAEGRFAFEELWHEVTRLRIEGPRIAPISSIDLTDHDDLADMEVVVPLQCRMQVLLEDEPALADGLLLLDARGEPLRIWESFGAFSSFQEDADLRDGRSSVLEVPETARTLVLLRDEVEVARVPIALDPSELTVVRP